MPISYNYNERDVSHHLQPALQAIEKVWSSHSYKHTKHLILPDGRSDFILKFITDENGKPTSIIPIIAGPSSSWWISHSLPNQGFVGIRFRPGSGGPFLGLPLASIAGRAFAGKEALALAPKIAGLCQPTPDVDALIEGVEIFFAKNHVSNLSPAIKSVIDDIHRSGGRTPIQVLAKKNGITSRTLARHFLKSVGISPKVFAAVIRFHYTLKLIKTGLTAHRAAFEAGYADQAHMTRDFRRFGGFTPGNIPDDLTLIDLPFS